MRTKVLAIVLALFAGRSQGIDRPEFSPPEETPAPRPCQLGGPATVDDAGLNAFSFPARTLTAKERRAFAVGNAFFKDNWVTAPASAAGRDGLGPLFNARSCSSCHLRDGRGRPPLDPAEFQYRDQHPFAEGLLLRLGVFDSAGPDREHPLYGGQLQDKSILGATPEGSIDIRYRRRLGQFGDGECYELVRPHYRVAQPRYGDLDGLALGPRVAPQLVGLGLLEAVPVSTLQSLADPDDSNGDGISGRIHWVHSRRTNERQPGRFGWKATEANVEDQVAAAFRGDIGITSTIFPEEDLTSLQRSSIQFESGGEPEISDHKLGRVTFYSLTLAVPAQRFPDSPQVKRGRVLFDEIGCANCHVPTLKTGAQAVTPSYEHATFHPYTDLLLHDLGPDLTDEKRDGEAAPQEWRTPPLWGIGLVPVVSGHTRYLHDGRARNLTEAVLWHGGEAEASRERFRQLPRTDREALIRFLHSL